MIAYILYSLAGIAGLYLLFFGELRRPREDEPGASARQVRVWLTYIALGIISVVGLMWFVGRYYPYQ